MILTLLHQVYGHGEMQRDIPMNAQQRHFFQRRVNGSAGNVISSGIIACCRGRQHYVISVDFTTNIGNRQIESKIKGAGDCLTVK
jgi:hypothetical protein